MTDRPTIRRFATGVIALVAWAGLAVQLDASIGLTGSASTALWAMLRYFTVIANLLVAIQFSGLALGGTWAARPSRIGGTTIAILLVGGVHFLLLRGLVELSAGALLADLITHRIVPILVGVYWLLLSPKGGLARRDPLYWAALPLGYFAYALARGSFEGIYAYPFLNVARIGWGTVLLNAVVIAAVFVAAGYGMLALDRRLAPVRR
jgi:hypothetical protein